MTSSVFRGRPRHAASYISVRVAHTVLGGSVSVAWLVLPVMTIGTQDPVPAVRAGPVSVAEAAAPEQHRTSPADLVVPLVAVGTAGVLAGYAYVRRTRRARTRTTPASAEPPARTHVVSDRQARAALVAADDAVRTSREELAWAAARLGAAAVEPFIRALRTAETELSAAFAIHRRYEEGLPGDAGARRQALVGVLGRCAEAGRRLDAEAAGFDRTRALERDAGGATEAAEGRGRELAGRAADAEATSAGLVERHGPAAVEPVQGYAVQARDRLVFAAAQLDRARQATGAGETMRAVRGLRAAEGALAQADVLVTGVARLSRDLREAAALVPAALTGAEAALADARRGAGTRGYGDDAPFERSRALRRPPGRHGTAVGRNGTAAGRNSTAAGRNSTTARRNGATADRRPPAPVPPPKQLVPVGELRARLAHADTVLAAVRQELTGGPYDPLDALRRIARAVEPVGAGRRGVVALAGFRAARSAAASAEDFVATHRAAVGAEARTLLAEAVRQLAQGDTRAADELARAARTLAERDVRVHGTPYAGAAGHDLGLAGAVLGGVLLGEEPDGGPPASFGGPLTRGRFRTG
ncbi:hypothetical protein ACFC09_19335 [Streptomyces sp. NPDC056161]|uniref:hypothetical protein n=1 Tax=Streptomyces sp. NPDC056161 TaxID=3345732 RepID=UPI0035E211B8